MTSGDDENKIVYYGSRITTLEGNCVHTEMIQLFFVANNEISLILEIITLFEPFLHLTH